MFVLCPSCGAKFLFIYISCLLQHVKVAIPSPKKDEVLLKLDAASLNASDWKIQEGVFRPLLPHRFPFTPGNTFPL